MKSLVTWLQRLATIKPEEVQLTHFRVISPGAEPLDIRNWLLSIDPQGVLGNDIRATCPESWSLIRTPDSSQIAPNLHERHRFAIDLASLLSLALDRKIVIPVDAEVQVQANIHFLPAAQLTDQSIIGPLPPDTKERLTTFLTAVAGLPDEHQESIGAAASAYYGALLLSAQEPRAAYTLLVAGIETLSRKYGSPPTEWKNWDESNKWDPFFIEQGLTQSQAECFRNKLMQNKQIKLGETFRNYASSRLNDNFWTKSLDCWIYGVNANTGPQLPAKNVRQYQLIDILPKDRGHLKKRLKESYNLRSGIVHQADWVELMSLAPPPAQTADANRPLPFPVLRLILAELIWLELSSHSKPTELPNLKLLRT